MRKERKLILFAVALSVTNRSFRQLSRLQVMKDISIGSFRFSSILILSHRWNVKHSSLRYKYVLPIEYLPFRIYVASDLALS